MADPQIPVLVGTVWSEIQLNKNDEDERMHLGDVASGGEVSSKVKNELLRETPNLDANRQSSNREDRNAEEPVKQGKREYFTGVFKKKISKMKSLGHHSKQRRLSKGCGMRNTRTGRRSKRGRLGPRTNT